MDIICIAGGLEGCRREPWLNVKDCEIIEDAIRADTREPVEIEYYYESLEEANQKPELILCRGRITIDAEEVRKKSTGNGKRGRSTGVPVVDRDFSSRIYAHWICGKMQYIGYA